MRTPMKKMLLGWLAVGGLALAAGRVFYGQTIHPIREQEVAAQHCVAELQSRVADARRVIGEVRAMNAQRGREQKEILSLLADLPASPTLVWFPKRMTQYFAGTGGLEVVTRLNTTLDDPALPGFERTCFAVEMRAGTTPAETREICLAIAELEPRDPSVRVLDVAIRPDADDSSRRVVVVNVAVLAPTEAIR